MPDWSLDPSAPLFLPGSTFLAAGAGLYAYAMVSPRSAIFGPVTWRAADPAPAAIALTFDDGPLPGSTDLILDILRREGVPGAFFVIGRAAQAHPDLVRRMHAEGHLVGNHSFDHHRSGMFRVGSYWRSQIERTGDAVHQAAGIRPALFRPPMGFRSPYLVAAAQALGCRVVTWSRRAFDGVRTAPDTIIRTVARSRPGEIILLHDGREPTSTRPMGATAAALPRLIVRLRERGLAFQRLDHFIDAPAYQPPLGPG